MTADLFTADNEKLKENINIMKIVNKASFPVKSISYHVVRMMCLVQVVKDEILLSPELVGRLFPHHLATF